jgi:transposase
VAAHLGRRGPCRSPGGLGQGLAAPAADPPGDHEGSDRAKGFVVIPKRGMVERTLGWFNRSRRLSNDDEYLAQTSETVIRVAMIHLMIRRLARIAPY